MTDKIWVKHRGRKFGFGVKPLLGNDGIQTLKLWPMRRYLGEGDVVLCPHFKGEIDHYDESVQIEGKTYKGSQYPLTEVNRVTQSSGFEGVPFSGYDLSGWLYFLIPNVGSEKNELIF